MSPPAFLSKARRCLIHNWQQIIASQDFFWFLQSSFYSSSYSIVWIIFGESETIGDITGHILGQVDFYFVLVYKISFCGITNLYSS